MSRTNLHGPETADEILRLCHGYLPWHRSLTLGLALDVATSPTFFPEARSAHAAHLPAGEALLCVLDGTVFGGAELGVVLTPERICWKNRGGAPSSVPWDDLDPASISAGSGALRIDDASIHVPDVLLPDLVELLKEIARRRHARDVDPYRDRPADLDDPEGPLRSVDELAQLVWQHLGVLDGLRYHPRIPARALQILRGAHAGHVAEDEQIAALHLSPGEGGGGLGLGLVRLYFALPYGKARFHTWKNLEPHTIKLDSAGAATVMGAAIPMPQGASAENLVALLQSLVRRAGGTDLPPIDLPPRR